MTVEDKINISSRMDIKNIDLGDRISLVRLFGEVESFFNLWERVKSKSKAEPTLVSRFVEVFEKARKLGQGQVDFDGVRIEMPTYLNALEVIKRFNELKSFIAD